MKLSLAFDPQCQVWTLSHEDCSIESSDDIREWASRLERALHAKGDERVDLLIDLDGFYLSPEVAAEYGPVAKGVVANHAQSLLRYGDPRGLTATSVRLQAIINHFPANIFCDRNAALAALQSIRSARRSAS